MTEEINKTKLEDLQTQFDVLNTHISAFSADIDMAFSTMHVSKANFPGKSATSMKVPTTAEIKAKLQTLAASHANALAGKVDPSEEAKNLSKKVSDSKAELDIVEKDKEFALSKYSFDTEVLKNQVLITLDLVKGNKVSWNSFDSENLHNQLALNLDIIHDSIDSIGVSKNNCNVINSEIVAIQHKLNNKHTSCRKISWLDTACVQNLENQLALSKQKLASEQANINSKEATGSQVTSEVYDMIKRLLVNETLLQAQISNLETQYQAEKLAAKNAAIKASENSINQYLSELVGLQQSLEEQINTLEKQVAAEIAEQTALEENRKAEIVKLEFETDFVDISFGSKQESESDNSQKLTGETSMDLN